jgi:drug/metabolite transporter (DMT)-like permease
MQDADKQRLLAMLCLVGTAVLWSLGGLLIKSVSWNPLAIAGGRSAIAALVMLAFRPKPAFTWCFAQMGGALAYAGTVILFVVANKMTTAANAILLQYTAPIYVALLSSWFLKERITKLDWAVIVLIMVGMALFFFDHLSLGGMMGNFLAILSGVSFACLALFTRKQKNAFPLDSLILGNLLTAVIGLPFMIGPLPDVTSLQALVLLGVVQLGFPYVLYAYALKHVTALEGILIPVIEPLLNPVWVFLALGEKPGRWAIVGGTFVLAAVTARSIFVMSQDNGSRAAREAAPIL